MKVYQAINAVQSELSKSGIAKDRENSFDKYKFRGIDDVYNALAPLLAKHQLCVLPRVLSREVVERESQKGGALFYVTVEAEFDFVSAEDGSKHTVKTFGEAMDRGDKATNKAMSAAYKYAAFQAFAIPTEGDNDADSVTHEVKAAPKKAFSAPHKATDGAMEALPKDQQEYIRELAEDVVSVMKESGAGEAYERVQIEQLDNDQMVALWSLLDSKTRSALKTEKGARMAAA